MADKKIITDELLKLQTEKVLQVIADNVYQEEEYLEQEIDDMFDATPQEISYYESLINPDVVSENRLWSSKTIDEKLASAILEANKYTDQASTRNLTTEIVSSTADVTKENVLYLILSDASTNTYEQYMLIGGTATALGSTQVDLSNIYNKSEVDTKLDDKANKSEVLSMDSVQATTGSETNDTVYTSKLTKDELDKKANNDEVVKKTDITTTIGSTSTDDTVPSAKAVYDSLLNKVNNPIVLNTADEVNNFDMAYQSFIIEPSVAEAVGLPKAPDSTWFCINLSHVKGFKYPSQIAFEYAGIERIMYRTAHNGVWHNWRKIPTTSVADVPVTNITTNLVSTKVALDNSDSYATYYVKSGTCYVTIWSLRLIEACSVETIFNGLPKSTIGVTCPLCNGVESFAQVFMSPNSGVIAFNANASLVNKSGYCSFSYPVAES